MSSPWRTEDAEDDLTIDISSGDDDDVPEKDLLQAASKKPKTSAAAKR